MTNGSLLLVEEKNCFAPVSQLNYEFVENFETISQEISTHPDIQAVVGRNFLPFGKVSIPPLPTMQTGLTRWTF